ncbi:MAG: hypothetical protein NT027_00300 [Proteobacteria bacterium]|nr:hypothetical protein [Pseudomonadota bacterium]
MVLESVLNKVKSSMGFSINSQSASKEGAEDLDTCLEIVVNWAASILGKNYFDETMEKLALKCGKCFPEDDFYQIRMSYYLEIAVLAHFVEIKSVKLTLVSHYFAIHTSELKVLAKWSLFASSRHSLFQVLRTSPSKIIVKDICYNAKHTIYTKSGETLKYFEKDSIFQGFIFLSGHSAYMGQGMIFHPKTTNKFLHKFIRQRLQVNENIDLEFLQQLALAQFRFSKMQHVDAAQVYEKYLSSAK